MMFKFTFFIIVFFFTSSVKSQISEINIVKDKYISWLTDSSISTYSNADVKNHYNRYIQFGNTAETNVNNNYNFISPGALWNMTDGADNQDFINLVNNHLFYLVMSYHLKGPIINGQPSNPKYHSQQLKVLILKIFKYIKDKGISSTTNFNFSINTSQETVNINNSGFGLRCFTYAACVLLMKEELLQEGEFSYHNGILSNLTSFIDPDNPNFNFTYPGFNTDVVRALIESRLCYVLGLDDNDPDKLENMEFLKNFTDNALLISNGWSDFIKPDFTTFHHRGVYANSYGAEALLSMSILNYVLKGSAYELSAISQKNIKNALMAYQKFSADFEMPRGFAGRFPNETTPLLGYRSAFSILYAADPIGNIDAGQFFKKLYNMPSAGYNNSLGVKNPVMAGQIAVILNTNITAPSTAIEGHFGFPYGGLSIHKYNGYQISVKGTSKHIWHYESSASENIFGRYTSAGAIEIFTSGIPKTRLSNGMGVADSNGKVTDNGWDWKHIPGVTAANIPLAQMAGGITREFNGKNFLAHASLDKNGVFAMDYKDVNSGTGMTALKTAFFMKDKVLLLGSNIKDAGGIYPIHTTLFQTGLSNTSVINYIDGVGQSGLDVNVTYSTGGHWMTDAVGNGFVIPTNGLNGILTFKRSTQQSRNQSNTSDTQGNYTTAYIDHGTSPASGTYRYGILLQGGSVNTQNFADNFYSYFDVIQQNEMAHAVRFIEDNIYNYVIFNSAAVFQSDALISVDKPAVVITQKVNNEKLKVSLTNPNLGLLTESESFTSSQVSGNSAILYRVSQIIPVKVILSGKWQLETPAGNIAVNSAGNTTEIIFNTVNGSPIQTTLVPQSFLNVLNAKGETSNYSIYPNPSKGKLTVKLNKKSKGNLKIFNALAVDVTSKVIHNREADDRLHLDVTALATGIYTICIDGHCKKITKY
jgi:chondroitin-sulfate-ABC endolyase/exolyase